MSSAPAKAREIFTIAVEQYSPDQWPIYLDEVCGDDLGLRKRVELLLEAHDGEESLLDSPAIATPTTIDRPLTEKPGTQVGPYKLLQQLGEGGMGVVYMAEQKEPVKRRVALKIIKPGMDSKTVIARFEAERQALAMMDHPNIAKVLDAGASQSGCPYFVMELVNGLPVTKYCDEQRLTPRERLELFVPICQAVQHAHQKGIIHRDLKPSNILVALYDGRAVPKIIDFGVAKATSQVLTEKTMFTQLGQVIGTLEYMSPEQAERNQLDIDTRSDVYSLGVLLYELLTGEPPFDRVRLRSVAFDEMLRIIREEEPSKPSTKVSSSQSLPSVAAHRHIEPARLGTMIRGELDWIVMKALEKDRARRYDSASKFSEDVQRFLNGEAVMACAPTPGYRFRKLAGRNKAAIAVSVVFLVTLLAGVVSTAWQARRAIAERDRSIKAEHRANKQRDNALAAEQQALSDRATLAAINDFLQEDLLKQASPDVSPSGDMTIREAVDRAAGNVEGRFEDQPLIEGSICHTLGNIYRALGDLPKAEQYFWRAQRIGENHKGMEDSDTLTSAEMRAETLAALGNLQEAEKLSRHVLEVRERTSGATHEDTYRARLHLATVLTKISKFREAQELLEQVLSYRRRELGDTAPGTLITMINLGSLLNKSNQLDEAETILDEALLALRESPGEKHPITLAAMGNLAAVLAAQGELDDAERLENQVLELRREVLGDEHAHTLSSMHNLADISYQRGKYDEAESLFRKTWEVQRRKLGDGHLLTMKCLGMLALIAEERSDHDEAEKLYRKVLADNIELPADHPFILRCKANLANALCGQQGRTREAEEILREAYEGMRRTLGEQHAHTQKAKESLAELAQTRSATD